MRPTIFGILNVTDDSFSDGGRYVDPASALAHASALVESGADVLDVGPASSHPDSVGVSHEVEMARIEPVLEWASGRVAVSVDSFLAKTQIACAPRVAYLNDIQGFADPAAHGAIADASCRLVVMHSVQGRGRATRDVVSDPATVMDQVQRFFETRLGELVSAGIAEERLIVDPGMGFFLGSNAEASVSVLRQLRRLHAFGRPVLISVSRKSLLGALTGRDVGDRRVSSAVAELFAATVGGAEMVRTHDPAAFIDAYAVWQTLMAP